MCFTKYVVFSEGRSCAPMYGPYLIKMKRRFCIEHEYFHKPEHPFFFFFLHSFAVMELLMMIGCSFFPSKSRNKRLTATSKMREF